MNTLRLTTLALGLMVSGMATAQTYVVDRYQDDSNKVLCAGQLNKLMRIQAKRAKS